MQPPPLSSSLQAVELDALRDELPFPHHDQLSEEHCRQLGEAHYRLSKIYYDKSDFEMAKHHFAISLDLCRGTKDFYFEFKVLGFLIRMASEALDQETAEKYIQRSEDITERVSHELGTLSAEVLYNMGIVKTYNGRFEEAFQDFQIATTKAKKENNPEVLAKIYYALASSNYQQKNLEMALGTLSQLSELLSTINKGYLNGTMKLLYGNIYSELGSYEIAIQHYQDAGVKLVQKNCWNLYGYILLGRGTICKKMGKYNEAMWYFKTAQESVDSSQFKRLSKLIYNEISNVNDSSIDIYLDYKNRMAYEKNLGAVDFRHRFVLLEILFLLAKAPGNHYSKGQLAHLIWGGEYHPFIHDKLVYTSISRLRKLIESKGDKNKYIIRGREGYAFNPRVNVRFNEEADTSVESLGNIDISSPV